jgi:hypothetical protein
VEEARHETLAAHETARQSAPGIARALERDAGVPIVSILDGACIAATRALFANLTAGIGTHARP